MSWTICSRWVLGFVAVAWLFGLAEFSTGQILTGERAGIAYAAEPGTRAFPPNRWVVLKPSGGGDRHSPVAGIPGFRGWHQVSYDLQFNEVVLFGGSAGTYMSDTWTYNVAQDKWTLKRPHPDLNGPCRRDMQTMAYDAAGKRHWLFNGVVYCNLQPNSTRNAIWDYNFATNTWTPHVGLPGWHNHKAPGLAYNSKKGTFLEFGGGGVNSTNGTYEFDPVAKAWHFLSVSTPKPPPRYNISGGLVYHKGANKFVLFGGLGKGKEPKLNDTWIFDPESGRWTEMTPAVSPPARDLHAMAYDEANQVVILFGGRPARGGDERARARESGESRGHREPLNDTWVYDIKKNTWTELADVGNPPGLAHHSAVYDPLHRVVIVVTGRDTLVFKYVPANAP